MDIVRNITTGQHGAYGLAFKCLLASTLALNVASQGWRQALALGRSVLKG